MTPPTEDPGIRRQEETMSETTKPEPWDVWHEDLRGGRYWCVRVPGVEDTITIHEDDSGEATCRRIARLPVLEAMENDGIRRDPLDASGVRFEGG